MIVLLQLVWVWSHRAGLWGFPPSLCGWFRHFLWSQATASSYCWHSGGLNIVRGRWKICVILYHNSSNLSLLLTNFYTSMQWSYWTVPCTWEVYWSNELPSWGSWWKKEGCPRNVGGWQSWNVEYQKHIAMIHMTVCIPLKPVISYIPANMVPEG